MFFASLVKWLRPQGNHHSTCWILFLSANRFFAGCLYRCFDLESFIVSRICLVLASGFMAIWNVTCTRPCNLLHRSRGLVSYAPSITCSETRDPRDCREQWNMPLFPDLASAKTRAGWRLYARWSAISRRVSLLSHWKPTQERVVCAVVNWKTSALGKCKEKFRDTHSSSIFLLE